MIMKDNSNHILGWALLWEKLDLIKFMFLIGNVSISYEGCFKHYIRQTFMRKNDLWLNVNYIDS